MREASSNCHSPMTRLKHGYQAMVSLASVGTRPAAFAPPHGGRLVSILFSSFHFFSNRFIDHLRLNGL